MGLIGPIECQSIDEMKTVMDTNFFGLVRLLKEVLPDMKRRKRGHIVVISSVMGIQGETVTSVHHESICLKCLHIVLTMSHSLLFCSGILFNDIYAASKFAVEGFCESLAVQALRFNLK